MHVVWMHFLWDTNKCTLFLSCGYPVEFFGDHRSKTKCAKDFSNMICITNHANCKPRYSKSELKNVFRLMGKTLLSVNAKIGAPVLLRQFRQLSNSYHCLVYVVLLENLNQISRTEKCHFAFYIFHEQRLHSFTSKFVKSRVFAWWYFLFFLAICILFPRKLACPFHF